MTIEGRNQDATAFLATKGFRLSTMDMTAILDLFLASMVEGLAGQSDALPMIPTFIDASRAVPSDEPVIVIDAGGTNVRAGVVHFNTSGEPTISDFSVRRMPGTEGLVSKDDFFQGFADLIRPFLDISQKVGFCFSYPVEIQPDRDGRLLYWSKEIKAPEVVGELIGANVAERLATEGHRPQVTVLNDTVATLLAGKIAGHEHIFDGFVGLILGTGTNTAYVEQNCRISKRADLVPDGLQPINVESGNFSRCPRTAIDVEFDADTQEPGAYQFEKMISGAYRGGLCHVLLRHAASVGLFSADAADAIEAWETLDTIHITHFLNDPLGPGPFLSPACDVKDRQVAYSLCRGVVDRAAILCAVNIAATVIMGGGGRDPARPACINADGSTFYKVQGFQTQVEDALRDMLSPRGLHGRIIQTPQAPTIGAAVAGLMGA